MNKIVIDGLCALFDQHSFYAQFESDILRAESRIIIESAFLTEKRVRNMKPILLRAVRSGVKVIVNTRLPENNEQNMRVQSNLAIAILQSIGVKVLLTVNHHRKLAVIDDTLLWEGSLNILSQADSCEIMRRIESRAMVAQTIDFINLPEWYS